MNPRKSLPVNGRLFCRLGVNTYSTTTIQIMFTDYKLLVPKLSLPRLVKTKLFKIASPIKQGYLKLETDFLPEDW